MTVAEKNQTGFHVWFEEFCRHVKNIYPESAIWIDVGTSKGGTVEIQSTTNADGQVVGFEPDPTVFAICHQRHQDKTNVTLYNRACYSSDRIQKYYTSQEEAQFGYGFIGMPPEHAADASAVIGNGTVDVKTMKPTLVTPAVLDQVLHDRNLPVRLIKVDAESSDFDVLLGAEDILTHDRPVVVFEFCGSIMTRAHGHTIKDFFDYFDKLNYKLFTAIEGQGRQFIFDNWNRRTAQLKDIVAVPVELEGQFFA
jgi:FkbM family methyltransferase